LSVASCRTSTAEIWRGWLYRIAHLTVQNFRRRAWFKNLFSRGREIDSMDMVGMSATPAMALEKKQDQRVLAQMLARNE